MLIKLILLFTILPFIELAILIKLSNYIGLGYTLFIVIFTGVTGAYLAKREGRGTIKRIMIDMRHGEIPKDELINGLCIVLGGGLLLAPGIITDITGFLLVNPSSRKIIKIKIKSIIQKKIHEGTFMFFYRK